MTQRATRQHILEATISTIEKLGVQNVTTRAIAQEAGVNNAALHYYYGTKERLVNEALALTLDHMMMDTNEILSGPGDITGRLHALFDYLIEGIMHYPNLIRAHLTGSLMEGLADTPFGRSWQAWMERACQELDDALPLERQIRLRYTLHAAFSGMLIAGLMQGSLPGISQTDFTDAEARRRYIDFVVDVVLGSKDAVTKP